MIYYYIKNLFRNNIIQINSLIANVLFCFFII